MKFLSLTKLTSFTVLSSLSGFTFALRRNLHKDNGGLSSCIDLRVTEYGLMRELNLISVANGDYSFYKAGTCLTVPVCIARFTGALVASSNILASSTVLTRGFNTFIDI